MTFAEYMTTDLICGFADWGNFEGHIPCLNLLVSGELGEVTNVLFVRGQKETPGSQIFNNI